MGSWYTASPPAARRFPVTSKLKNYTSPAKDIATFYPGTRTQPWRNSQRIFEECDRRRLPASDWRRSQPVHARLRYRRHPQQFLPGNRSQGGPPRLQELRSTPVRAGLCQGRLLSTASEPLELGCQNLVVRTWLSTGGPVVTRVTCQ